MHADVSRGVAPIHRRKRTDLMVARMDGWTTGTRRQTLNLLRAPSCTIAYLYYKTAVNLEIHYHKLNRHRIVHVSDGMPRKRNNVYYNIKLRDLHNSSLFMFIDTGIQGHWSRHRPIRYALLKKIFFLSRRFVSNKPRLFENCLSIGFGSIACARLVMSLI